MLKRDQKAGGTDRMTGAQSPQASRSQWADCLVDLQDCTASAVLTSCLDQGNHIRPQTRFVSWNIRGRFGTGVQAKRIF